MGAVSSGAFGTHQRVTLTSVTQLPPSSCPLEEGPCEKGEVRRGDKRLQVPEQGTKNIMVWVLVGKEFPDMRQYGFGFSVSAF